MRKRSRSHRPIVEALEDRQLLSAAPTAIDQEFLERLNDARANPTAYGQSIGVDLSYISPSPPLAFVPSLIQSATDHSNDMNVNNYFSHTGSDGSSPFQRMSNDGFAYQGAAESIADGFSTPEAALAGLITDSGIPDLGHRNQLLSVGGESPQQEVGVGIVLNGTGSAHNYYTIDSGWTSNQNPYITGVVYKDANSNGLYDAGEGLGGVTITIAGVGSTTTWDSGGYSFQLAPGTYTVTASGGNLGSSETKTITVGSTNYRLNWNPIPTVTIDNGQSGYSETGSGWGTYSGGGYNGSLRVVAAGSGANTATWTFTGLSVGTYNAAVDWLADPNNRASNATYQVYDGSTLIGTEVVNQRQAPVGTSAGGVTFQSLGTFNVNSGTLRIVLTDKANGLVIADAAQVSVTTPPAPQIVDNGQSGYSETGTGWSSYAAGYGGSFRDIGPGSGANTATWTFTSLPGGTYNAAVDWLADPNNRASNATYAVYDGNTLLSTVTIDQRQVPVGTSAGGVTFQSLGSFTITSGTLRIVLSDKANGLIIADAAEVSEVTPPTLPEVVDNGQSGYSETGSGWGTYSGGGYNNNLRIVAAGTGANTATWTFTGLSAGTYSAAVDWLADPNNRASNATYQVFDGSTLVGTVTVNQRLSPVGTSSGGVTFQSLGNFTISSGTLRIVLSDNANGLIIADAAQVSVTTPLTLPAVIDYGQTGYSETGSGWSTYSGAGYGGSIRDIAAGTGANTVSWSFTGLAGGTYNAQVDWLADPNNRASNATYKVYDGSTLLGTVTVNQQQAPVGTTVGGVTFQSLGSFTITSGTLEIVLSDNANGLVIADAARLTT